ncbi:MAG TPA: hypothetical protein VGI10_14280 [Polyangiaceae bacterium]
MNKRTPGARLALLIPCLAACGTRSTSVGAEADPLCSVAPTPRTALDPVSWQEYTPDGTDPSEYSPTLETVGYDVPTTN